MNILALECSSRCGSMALLADDRVLAECEWIERASQGQHFFRCLPTLCQRAGVELEAVDLFAVGRGPGDYSGLRMSMVAVRSFALPGKRRVHAVSSGEALARMVARDVNARFVAVLGDARRDTLWLGVFQKRPDGFACILPWTLTQPADLGRHLPEGTRVVSPDWSRLAGTLPLANLAGISWSTEDVFPRASEVGLLAVQRERLHLASEPLTPIYLHAAVAKAASHLRPNNQLASNK